MRLEGGEARMRLEIIEKSVPTKEGSKIPQRQKGGS